MTTNATSTAKGTSRDFFIAVLEKLGIKPTEGDLEGLYAVEHLEGDNQRYNPLNVIQPEPGSHAFNSVGVQSYASFDTGVAGTATLLSNSHWTGVRAALKAGNLSGVLSAFKAAYTWDPGVQFPTSTSITDHEANRMVGPAGPSATLAADISGLKIPIPGTGTGIDINGSGISVPTPGSVIGGAASGVWADIEPYVTTMAFAGAALALVVGGLWSIARPAVHEATETVETGAKAGAAAA